MGVATQTKTKQTKMAKMSVSGKCTKVHLDGKWVLAEDTEFSFDNMNSFYSLENSFNFFKSS